MNTVEIIKKSISILKESNIPNKEVYMEQINEVLTESIQNEESLHMYYSFFRPKECNITPQKYNEYLIELAYNKCGFLMSQTIVDGSIRMSHDLDTYVCVSSKFAIKTLRILSTLHEKLDIDSSSKLLTLLNNSNLIFIEKKDDNKFNITQVSWSTGISTFDVGLIKSCIDNLQKYLDNGALHKLQKLCFSSSKI